MSRGPQRDLFGNPLETVELEDGALSPNAHLPRLGSAGHHLIIGDLNIRGFDAWETNGINIDIVVEIDATMRRLQAKSSVKGQTFGSNTNGYRLPGSGSHRTLKSYKGKIQAFAFVNLSRRLVYYVHIDAIASNTFRPPQSAWTRQACEMSFDEMIRRFRGEAA